ncbi:DUF5367 domain-containing protein [Fictibacillus barbaricus]|uniref:DUF5367 domain-containing protein n=1 Tax=Fictibacillus barbaricus TaxID=182136 RepID=A0ABS2ZC55_9BACL|nr:DUF5367 domain-containing protein [Fictibacillus barbaricus]MBN3545520.1 DUF5367 domain-containing protein [Fictibacillus barbaricus]GGB54079.1 hypothetical protein GCM10007199_19730 [Fictibacillus barbaricus]
MFFLFWGFLVWLSASAIFRLTGQFFFILTSPVLLIVSYILVIPLIIVLTLPIYRWKKLNSNQQLKAAIFIALPGMLLDTIVLIFFSDIFTNLKPETDRIFGSWLLWAYSLILLSGFFYKKKKS